MTDAVELHPYDPAWPQGFQAEAAAIAAVLAPLEIVVHHIGSTAVAGLIAKPVIDLLGVAPSLPELDARSAALTQLGYREKGANGIAGRRYFVRRGADGSRLFHLHCYAKGAPQIAAHLAFRDLLRREPQLATAYAERKLRLVAQGPVTRAAYEAGKADFIAAALARCEG